MNNSSFYRLIGATALVLAMGSTAALALALGDLRALVPDAAALSVPSTLSVLIWGPIVALSLVCCLGLVWLLRDPASEQQVDTAAPPVATRKPRTTRPLRLPALAHRRAAAPV